ncbi:phage tail protein [Arthrobacter sp. I2-34]|uniref:Phage tail protein n=1 Tax=Arthrobacter hankyongi TaxID=2904801 RepID=A0ABS9L6X1_9MICC|nr:phage tail protein [Arthrobacter hankyongi]MCG2622421.1 phage tail protein [Arthrobacter hankyongi]
MRLSEITALPHPGGNRIDLSWRYPEAGAGAGPDLPDIRIRRDLGSHPVRPDDGVQVAEVPAGGSGTVADTGLQGETVYYYTLFTRAPGEAEFTADPHNRVCAMATSPYGFAGHLYGLLPAIYRRYDAAAPVPAALAPEDAGKGVLQRFLELPGTQLDQLYSLARAALDLHDLDRVDGRLLPLLAQWIGWRTDFGLPVRAQRQEIRFAPWIYRCTGTLAALEATARRVTGLPIRTKEFVHNVACTNQPERLNLWAVVRDDAGGAWGTPGLVSVNFAYEGRAAHVREADGSELFFYHTHRRHGWDIWAKPRTADGTWAPSAPVVDRTGVDKHPAAARAGQRLWLFWETRNPADPAPRWRIGFQLRSDDGGWSPPQVSGQPGTGFLGSGDAERRHPCAAADDAGGVWLFWQEFSAGRWQIRYNRHDGTRWQLEDPRTLSGDAEPGSQEDLFLLVRPAGAGGRLWLFGARQEPAGPAPQTRWSVVYRVKDGLDPGQAGDWQAARLLPKPALPVHDREPAALAGPDGGIELFFASTRSPAGPEDEGGWSVFRTQLADPATHDWAPAQPAAVGPVSQRAPLAVRGTGATLLLYRSSEPLIHAAAGEASIPDTRYAGTTTYAGHRKARAGSFGDTGTYTYTRSGGGPQRDGRIARDAVGIFLAKPERPVGPDQPVEPEGDEAAPSRLAAVLPEFLPINARGIVIGP